MAFKNTPKVFPHLSLIILNNEHFRPSNTKVFCVKFDGTETTNVQPSESLHIYSRSMFEQFYLYHVSIACFTKRAWKQEYLEVLTFFGSHMNFCRPQKVNYNYLSLQDIGKHRQIRILPLHTNQFFRDNYLIQVLQYVYGTNHPQRKRHTCVYSVQKQKTCMASNHSCTRMCTHLYTCKMNAPHIRTYPYEVSATKLSSLHPVVP